MLTRLPELWEQCCACNHTCDHYYPDSKDCRGCEAHGGEPLKNFYIKSRKYNA